MTNEEFYRVALRIGLDWLDDEIDAGRAVPDSEVVVRVRELCPDADEARIRRDIDAHCANGLPLDQGQKAHPRKTAR